MPPSPACRAIIFGNMSNFDGIPAVGDVLVGDDEEEVGSGEESEEVGRDEKYRFNGKHIDMT